MSDEKETTEVKPETKVFGANSYHYFHDSVKERAANGDVAPMAQPKLVATTESSTEKKKPYKNISKYSWSDGKKFVTLYIDFPGIGAIQDKVTIEYRKRSFVLKVVGDTTDHILKIIRLSQLINGEGSSLRFKDNQMVLKLSKDDTDKKWYDLCKTTARGVLNSDSEE
eukprot:TRINITY_DN1393_c6_g1_i1.p1 TRINITY_DN1393_c6_g1~~TRINITY_DN1393_c6_g1_i1.p1  ORF type:complete len:168 (+),score=48.37 TRINITY_DN1393_c6_g1_i1:44-547(+)